MTMIALPNGTRSTRTDPFEWTDVCNASEIVPGTGVAALVLGQQVAIYRVAERGPFYALSNFDPFSRAFVMSRGIIGDKAGRLKVASPIYKQNFELATGRCLDDPSVSLPSYPVRVVKGRIQVAAPAKRMLEQHE